MMSLNRDAHAMNSLPAAATPPVGASSADRLMMNLYDITGREYLTSSHKSRSNILRSVFLSADLHISQEIRCSQVVNGLDIDTTRQFLLAGEADGCVKALDVSNGMDGRIKLLQQKKFSSGFVTGVQWFPNDNGLFCVAYNNRVVIVDTNTFSVCDSHVFGQHQLFWCDWSELDGNLIAVAASASTIRLIDVRSGGSLHSITLSSPLGVKDHSVTRVLWDKSDSDALFAGDSSGCLHLYDVRATRNAIQVLSPDNHIFQTITCLQLTPGGMSLVTSHGVHNYFTLWKFQSKKLVNSNVHFEMPVKRKGKEKKLASGLVRTQVFMTSDLLFSPVASGSGDVMIHDLVNGARLRTLDSGVYSAVAGRKENVVTGSSDGFPVLYSAGQSGIRVWSPKIDQEIGCNPLHQDDWSDVE